MILLTSIDPGALRRDLGDRVLLVDLELIDETSRQTERDIEDRYQAARPQISGALLDLLSCVLAELPPVRLERLPRMADFGRILAALDAVIGTDGESSFEIYMRQRGRVADTVIESDPVALAIESLVQEGSWHGTARELLARIAPEHPSKEWPRSPQGLGGRIARLTPAQGLAGIRIQHGREGHDRSRRYHITRAADEAGELSAMSASSANGEFCVSDASIVRTTADEQMNGGLSARRGRNPR